MDIFTFGLLVILTLQVISISGKVRVIMATVTDLINDVDLVEFGVADLAKEIADLKANGGLVTQAQLDALDAKAQAILQAIEAAK